MSKSSGPRGRSAVVRAGCPPHGGAAHQKCSKLHPQPTFLPSPTWRWRKSTPLGKCDFTAWMFPKLEKEAVCCWRQCLSRWERLYLHLGSMTLLPVRKWQTDPHTAWEVTISLCWYRWNSEDTKERRLDTGASPAELICIQGVDKDSLGTKSGVQGKRRALETESQEWCGQKAGF